jgi:hypothetical protein
VRSRRCNALSTGRKKTHGKTARGKPITDELVGKLGEKAEAGYDVDETLRQRRGRHQIQR